MAAEAGLATGETRLAGEARAAGEAPAAGRQVIIGALWSPSAASESRIAPMITTLHSREPVEPEARAALVLPEPPLDPGRLSGPMPRVWFWGS